MSDISTSGANSTFVEKMDTTEDNGGSPRKHTIQVCLVVSNVLLMALTVSKAEVICQLLLGLAKRWQDIGVKVGLSSSEVHMMEADYKDKTPEECLSHVISHWLSKEDVEVITWEKVVGLLKAMGEEEQAKILAEEKGYH